MYTIIKLYQVNIKIILNIQSKLPLPPTTLALLFFYLSNQSKIRATSGGSASDWA